MAHPPFSMPGMSMSRNAGVDDMPSIQNFIDDLPSIDLFVEQNSSGLRSIDEFIEEDEVESVERTPVEKGEQHTEFDADGWAVSGWQSFNWSGAAVLGSKSESRSESNDSWDKEQWSPDPLVHRARPGRRGSPQAPPSAAEVAEALDCIARRIRSGDLLIDQLSGTPPEAAMAAAIAALLRTRD